MNATDFYNHVWNNGICSTLIDSGTIDEEWASNYCEFLDREKKKYLEQFTWPIEVFRGIHFASLYIPSRYKVWRTSHSANIVTEKCLERIKIASESFLWNCLLDVDTWSKSQLTDAEVRLVGLCFEEDLSALILRMTAASQQWKQQYRDILQSLSCDYVDRKEWPQIVCMAIRFASWILDLFKDRDIELGIDHTDDEDLLRLSSAIVDGLRNYVWCEDTLSMIRIWIQTIKNPIDHSGAPMIGKPHILGFGGISVRTLSEIFIQRGSIV